MPCSRKKDKWCPMATCSFIKEAKQTAGAMKGVMPYVSQDRKALDEDGIRYLTGVNCVAKLAYQSFMATKNLYGKAHDTFFYQYVQSFSPQEQITPAEAHRIALELAEKFFPGCEVLGATHLDTDHLHSHFIVNSVQPDTGRKLHFTPRTLENMRMVSDQICREHGLSTLKPYRQEWGEKGIKTGEGPGRRSGRELEISADRHRGDCHGTGGEPGGLHLGNAAERLRCAMGE